MSDNGAKREFDVTSLGIVETDSCPCCKRQLKGLVEENEGGAIVGKNGDWLCLNCGVVFMPKSKLEKIKEVNKPSGIIKPQLVVPGMRS